MIAAPNAENNTLLRRDDGPVCTWPVPLASTPCAGSYLLVYFVTRTRSCTN